MAHAELEAIKETDEEIGMLERDEETNQVLPVRIQAIPQPKDNIDVLCLLTEAECPPLRRIRVHHKAIILVLFWGCFGRGFWLEHRV
jgi:hypothetical protein